MTDWNKKIIEEFRSNQGKVGGHFENTPLLLLHSTGAKSGAKRINPAAYFMDDGRYVVIASKGGAPRNPDWYHNVKTNPNVEFEVGAEIFKGHAAIAEEPERSELYAKMVSINPGFAEYEKKASRIIPVVILNK